MPNDSAFKCEVCGNWFRQDPCHWCESEGNIPPDELPDVEDIDPNAGRGK